MGLVGLGVLSKMYSRCSDILLAFNTVNSLRLLGHWMRLFVIPNQYPFPQAYTHFTEAHDSQGDELDALLGVEGGSRLMPSSNSDRVVDCMEDLAK